jgi:hypothetical protein
LIVANILEDTCKKIPIIKKIFQLNSRKFSLKSTILRSAIGNKFSPNINLQSLISTHIRLVCFKFLDHIIKDSKIQEFFMFARPLLIVTLAAFALQAQTQMIIQMKNGKSYTLETDDISRIEFRTPHASIPQDLEEYSHPSKLRLDGNWATTEGVIAFRQEGRRVNGSYNPAENGQIVGELSGNTLTGYWIEDASGQRCSRPMNGRYFWGQIKWVFDGSRFNGSWGYCDGPLNAAWSGSKQ